jgi:hypothetical protein
MARTKIDFPNPTVAEFERKMAGVRAGTEGTVVGDTSSTGAVGVYGCAWKSDRPGISRQRQGLSKSAGDCGQAGRNRS